MHHLRTVSLFMTILGVALVAATLLVDAGPTVGLIGMMLFVAGAVKIIIVRLWQGVAGFGAPVAAETSAPPARRKE